jgi:hypothetical protein
MTKARHSGFARLTQKDVNASAARHEMLHAGRVGGARAVFAFCDLSGLDLSGRNLCDADFTEVVWNLNQALEGTDLKLAATTHITNPLFLKPGSTIKSIVNGGCLLVKPNNLRFDEKIRLSADVDYAVQHIVRFGGALRSNELVMRFKRRAPGGVQFYRDEYERDKSVMQLMKKWPGLITRAHHDRNHPVLHVQRTRSVLR